MNFIIELITLIEKHPPNKIEIVGNEKKTNTKIGFLYDAIKEGKVQSDDDGIQLIYDSQLEIENYKKLKYRLKDRLINSLFFIGINQPHFTNIQTAYYRCHKNWSATKILLGRGVRKSAMELSKKTLRQAIRYEFTELIINLSRTLRFYYATVEGDKKEFKYYNKLLQKHLPILEAELHAETLYTDLIIDFVNSKATKSSLLKKAKAYAKDLQIFKQNCQSYYFVTIAYAIFVLQHEIINKHTEVIEECLKAIEILKNKPYTIKNQLYGFASKAFISYVKLGNYKSATTLSYTCIKVVEKGMTNWFKFYQLYLIFLCHTKQYNKTPNILQEIISNSNLPFQSKDTIQAWKVYEAYIYLLCISDKVNKSDAQSILINQFKLGKFMNEVPEFSKDKKGWNIHIIILQLSFLLINNKYDKIIDKTAALNRYSSRYLRKDDSLYRSNCFIKMLIQLPKGNFHKIAVERKAKKFKDKLLQIPIQKSNQASDFEIVPFEILWQLTLDNL